MDGVKKVMSPEQFDRLASGYERYSVRSGEQTQDDKGMLVELNDALAREARLEMSNLELAHHNAELIQKCNALDKSEAALREELAEIKESLAYRGSLLNRTQQRAEAAEQRSAELERDAARYRWLRDINVGPATIDRLIFQTVADDCNPPYRDMKHGVDLDAAIDSQIKPTESGASDRAVRDLANDIIDGALSGASE